MQKPTWIIFDVGGVLLDWRTGIKDVAKLLEIEEAAFLEIFSLYWDDTLSGKLSLGEAMSKVLKQLSKEHDPEDVIAAWHQTKNWIVDTIKLMEELATKGYDIALLTNAWNGVEKHTAHVWKSPYISEVFDSSVLKIMKPDPKIYQYVEEKLGRRGSELFFIDDSQENLTAAEEFGWQTFLYDLGRDQGKTANNKLREMLLNKEN